MSAPQGPASHRSGQRVVEVLGENDRDGVRGRGRRAPADDFAKWAEHGWSFDEVLETYRAGEHDRRGVPNGPQTHDAS